MNKPKYLTQIEMQAPVVDPKDVTTKEFVEERLGTKADAQAATDLAAHVANKTNPHGVTLAQLKAAPLASPVFTGTPKAPTPAPETADTQVATTAFVKLAVDSVKGFSLFAGTITGNGTLTEFTVTHNLNTKNINVQTYDATGNQVWFGVQATTVNAIKLTTALAPANGEKYSVVVVGVPA